MDWNTILVDLGEKVLPWAVTALVGLLSKYVWQKIKSDYWRGVLDKASQVIFDGVLEVQQTYAAAIKAGREDGKLTEEEKAEAKKRVLENLKSYLGPRGFAELAKIFGGASQAEAWAGSKIESTVATLKSVSPK